MDEKKKFYLITIKSSRDRVIKEHKVYLTESEVVTMAQGMLYGVKCRLKQSYVEVEDESGRILLVLK